MRASYQKNKEKLLENYGSIKNTAFDFSRIERYFLQCDKQHHFQTISNQTYHDLDMDEVFMLIDRTTSRIGQQYIYYLLRTLPPDQKRTETLERLMTLFAENQALKEKAIVQLARLSKQETYYVTALFQEEHIEKPNWFGVIPVLSLISVSSVVLAFFFPQFTLVLITVLIINYIIHYWNKKNLYQYGGSIPQLLVLNLVLPRKGRQ
ncbi:MAG: hypothetical protein RIG62_31415 [Cyclobacteriaceae bacterium]|jgi:hypothetical protein